MKLLIFLILHFECYMIQVFLVIHSDGGSGLRTHLKLTAVLTAQSCPQPEETCLRRQSVSCFPGNLDLPGSSRWQAYTQKIRGYTLRHRWLPVTDRDKKVVSVSGLPIGPSRGCISAINTRKRSHVAQAMRQDRGRTPRSRVSLHQNLLGSWSNAHLGHRSIMLNHNLYKEC